jgi:hypothetical protein
MSKKKTTDEFINQAREIHGKKYDYTMVNYINNSIKVLIICPIHGEFVIRPNDHLSKKVGCNKCYNAGVSKKNKVANDIINRFKKVHKNRYDYSLVNYDGYDKKVDIICPLHGVFKQTPHHHIDGSGCLKCGGTNKLTTEEFIKKAIKIHDYEYDYSLVEYKNNITKVKIICKTHGIFEQKPVNHITKMSGCPICKHSKGENEIRLFLLKNDIKFISQKRFKKCRDKKTLPFDFFLNDLNICIEYDGEQHFLDRCTFGGGNRFLDIKRKDKIKDMYCQENNILLIRINYKDNIEEMLKGLILSV